MDGAIADAVMECCVTDNQRKVVRVLLENGWNVSGAARQLNCSRDKVKSIANRIAAKALKKGIDPRIGLNADQPGFSVKGTSTLYDCRTGEPVLRWVKANVETETAADQIKSFLEDFIEGIRGKSPTVSGPEHCDEDLLAVYPLGDPHFGMLAVADECGDNFDLKIAEATLVEGIDRLIESAPPAKQALFISLGDLLHINDSRYVTPSSEHRLDVDTRFQRVYSTARKTMGLCIQRLLQKHETIEVWMMPGNHDPDVSIAIADGLDAFFHNEDRVMVRCSPSWFAYKKFGKVLIGATHGDKAKPQNLPLVMATDRPEDWGSTQFRYWYCGHIHHKAVLEEPGVVVESFRTLAAKDAWHAAMGYRSGRDLNCIIHHRDYGEIERHRCDIATMVGKIAKVTGK